MSDTDRENLLAQANELGLEFPSNIPSAKLEKMINEALEGLPSADPEPVDEVPPPSPRMKKDAKMEPDKRPLSEFHENPAIARQIKRRLQVKKIKDAAMKTQVVTITNRDSRENDLVTTAYLSCENQFFSISKIVPLDVPVELEKCLIDQAKAVTIPAHRDEIKNGRRTGNKRTVMVKKYTISYSEDQPNN